MIGVLHDHSWAFIQRHLQCTKVINKVQIELEEDFDFQSEDEDDNIDIENEEEKEVHEENPVTNSEAIECLSKLRSHFQSLGGTPETFQGIQHMEKILFKNKMEESSKQTKITDAFSVNQLILRE